jgi:hypothetical protein
MRFSVVFSVAALLALSRSLLRRPCIKTTFSPAIAIHHKLRLYVAFERMIGDVRQDCCLVYEGVGQLPAEQCDRRVHETCLIGKFRTLHSLDHCC